MSVCFNLYIPNPDVEYNGCVLDNIKIGSFSDEEACKEIEKQIDAYYAKFGANDNSLVEHARVEDAVIASYFSDNKKHDVICLGSIKGFFKSASGKMAREWRRVHRKLIEIDCKYNFKRLITKNNQCIDYLVVTSAAYAQGWCLKKRFFKRRNWYFIYDTKDEMNRFFDRYFDNSDAAKAIRKQFNDAWKPNMLFECSF